VDDNIAFSLTQDRIEQMVDYIIEEPKFADSPIRCFKLPFVATEAFISDSDHIKQAVLGAESKVLPKLMSYFK
jgi:hypothetical protein